MFAILRARLAHAKRWISHFGICLLAGAGLVAALAPAGAAASARQAHRVLRRNLDHPAPGRKASRLSHRMHQPHRQRGPCGPANNTET